MTNQVLLFYMVLAALGGLTAFFETCIVCMRIFRLISGGSSEELAARDS